MGPMPVVSAFVLAAEVAVLAWEEVLELEVVSAAEVSDYSGQVAAGGAGVV